jgi:predicted RNA-binding protein with PUA-like domain
MDYDRARMAYWLIKSEPSVYAWSKFVKDGKARWDGIRSFEARNNLRAMKVGDLCFY